MLEISKLRSHLQPCSPTEALDNVLQILSTNQMPEDFHEPLFSIFLKSGANFKANLVGGSNSPKAYVFSLMIERDMDTARDIMYVSADSIEAVVAWDVDEYARLLPLKK